MEWCIIITILDRVAEQLTYKQYVKSLNHRVSNKYSDISKSYRLVTKSKTLIKSLDEVDALISQIETKVG